MNATAHDVVIRCATIRVVRRGGWSWGPDVQALVNSVRRSLPELLAGIIERNPMQPGADMEITAPLKVAIRLRLAELQRLAASSSADDPHDAHRTIVEAIARAGRMEDFGRFNAPPAEGATETSATSSVGNDEDSLHEASAGTTPVASARALLDMLRQWRRNGALAQRCSTLPLALLRQWLDHLGQQWPIPSAVAAAPTDEDLDQALEQVRREPVLLPAGEHSTLVRRVLLASHLDTLHASRSQAQRLLENDTREAAADYADRSADADTRLKFLAARSPDVPDIESPDVVPSVLPLRHAGSRDFAIDVPSALPFLLLGPLSRIGYLEALQVACNVAGGTRLSIGFAAALAYKVLQAPLRGWYREMPQRQAAAVFAGLSRVVEDQEIAAAAYALSMHAPLLDQLIGANLAQGHRAEAPWLLCAGEQETCILFDSDGLFPVAVGSPQALATSIAPSGSPLYLAHAATSVVAFETLDRLQIPYVARSNQGSRGLRISRHGGHQGRMRAFAERGEELCERAMAAWHTIRFERPVFRSSADSTLETSLTLAASLALATLAWTLWRSHGMTDPRLALERFSTLDARIHSTAAGIHVRLPLGRRFWDLREHGLLADVRDVPWLDGRHVTFGAG